MFRALAIMAVCFVAWPTPSDACSKRHQTPFELFDEATTVALVNVRAPRAARRHASRPATQSSERCERVRGVSLFLFAGYFAGAGSPQMWQALADACRTGKPAF